MTAMRGGSCTADVTDWDTRTVIVRTAQGRVRGLARPGDQVFRAIPYTTAPVGPGRFARPEPHVGWDGIRDATRPGPRAPGLERTDFGALDLSPVLGTIRESAGDYLSVTVTTPDTTARGLPVLVYLHGGGLTSGTGQADLYDGASYARDGIVLVTVNYRLGAPGWLHLPDAPDNRGLLDVLAALGWVAQNIHAFGGDPGRVTVAGQSAGAMIVACLLAAPAAEGLFCRAISQSGNGLCAYRPEHAYLVTRSFAGMLAQPPTAEALGRLPDERLVQALALMPGIDHAAHGLLDPTLGNSPLKPVIDGEVLTGQPADVVRATGRSTAESLLIGSNAQEGNLYLVPHSAARPVTEADLAAIAARRSHEPQQLISGYRARHPDADPGDLAGRIITDLFNEGSQALASAHAAVPGARTFGYEFAWRSAAFGGTLGACHCVELPFTFAASNLPALYGERGLLGPGMSTHAPGAGEAIAALAARTHAAWASFVTDADPGWSARSGHDLTTMRIDDTWELIESANSGSSRSVGSPRS
ncbi:MAG TPA: carboxylesterase family protein [Actinocrinis sp.]|nr:carboxylesterase family protein [Actinocrinis sp.]